MAGELPGGGGGSKAPDTLRWRDRWNRSKICSGRTRRHKKWHSKSRMSAAPPVEPHVIVEVMGAVLPLADIYVGVISAALYDAVRSALPGARRENTDVRFEVLLKDGDGRTVGYAEGRTSAEEVVKELLRRGGDAAREAGR